MLKNNENQCRLDTPEFCGDPFFREVILKAEQRQREEEAQRQSALDAAYEKGAFDAKADVADSAEFLQGFAEGVEYAATFIKASVR